MSGVPGTDETASPLASCSYGVGMVGANHTVVRGEHQARTHVAICGLVESEFNDATSAPRGRFYLTCGSPRKTA